MNKYSIYFAALLFFFTLQAKSNCVYLIQKNIHISNDPCPDIDTSQMVITPSTCNGSDGSITGIKGIGIGEITLKWYDIHDKLVASQANLTNVPAGTYFIYIVDKSQCVAGLRYVFVIPVKDKVIIDNSTTKIKTADCNQNDGAVTSITITNAVKYQWLDDENNQVATTTDLVNVTQGKYTLFATNKEGCSVSNSYNVPGTGKHPSLVKIDTIITNCGEDNELKLTFSILNSDPVFNYYLIDADGKKSHAGTIMDNFAEAGTATVSLAPNVNYKFVVTDDKGCATVLGVFSLPDNRVLKPAVSNINLCLAGTALIKVNDITINGTYTLYDSTNAVISKNSIGQFPVTVKNNSIYYVSHNVNGCESAETKVTITVATLGIVIPNAFTPNNDGINDYWNISGMENHPDALIQVFNRYGQKLYESKGYAIPFDGTCNRRKLPVGIYYYIINFNTGCSISGSLTIIR